MRTAPLVNIHHIELNTVCNPTPGFRDESSYIWCPKCGNRLVAHWGMGSDPVMELLTDKHLEFCEGELGYTLLLVQKWYREGGEKELVTLRYEEELRRGLQHKPIGFRLQKGSEMLRVVQFDVLRAIVSEVTE